MPRASQGSTSRCPSLPLPRPRFPLVRARRRPLPLPLPSAAGRRPPAAAAAAAAAGTHVKATAARASLVKWCCVYGTTAPRPVSPQSQPNGDITKTTGPTRVLSSVRAKLSYEMVTLWDTAVASAQSSLPVQSSLSPNLRATSRKRRGLLKFPASSGPGCPTN